MTSPLLYVVDRPDSITTTVSEYPILPRFPVDTLADQSMTYNSGLWPLSESCIVFFLNKERMGSVVNECVDGLRHVPAFA